MQEKKSDRCQIIAVAIPSDYKIQKKATEKMSKYVDLQNEWQRLWNKKVEVIPVIKGATGTGHKDIKKYVGRIPGCHNIYSMQRSAILGTVYILIKGTVNKVRLSNSTRHPNTVQVQGVGNTLNKTFQKSKT